MTVPLPANGPTPGAPTREALATATAIAFLVALVLLVAIVLPAEFGRDPLGTGSALGLTALHRPASPEPVAPPDGMALSPTPLGTIALYPAEFKVDAREFVLGPYEYVEYKYHLAKDATMLFSWSTDGAVIQDFHAAPDGSMGGKAEQSFDKEPRRQADGSFVAPFSGIHGWYWENPGSENVTVKVTTAGFYTSAHEFHYSGTRQTRVVRGLEAIPTDRNQGGDR